ncbi:MAG: 2-phosphosulfolactate phosphatase, partial [Gemmatimonadaceae bacterium]
IDVDDLSFTTCVDVATGRGAAIMPYAWNDATAVEFAATHSAELALKRGLGRYSLAPASYLDAPSSLRCVLPSPNGAVVTLRAARTPSAVLAGCLRNASAVAAAAERIGTTVNVCPAGERWHDGTLRPALEDWVAAGAILSQLQGSKSPEADAAIAAFGRWRDDLTRCLAECGSGRELLARGHAADIEIAAAYDVSAHVPRLHRHEFSASSA